MTALIWVLGVFLALVVAVFLWVRPRPEKVDSHGPHEGTRDFGTEFALEIAPPAALPARASAPELPNHYDTSRLVLLARDPNWLYAYWEVSATSIEAFKRTHGSGAWQSSRPVLRVYDVTGVESFNGHNAVSFVDIPVPEAADNWHIGVHHPNRSFCVDLGRILSSGTFVTILRSNIATTPQAGISDRLDEEWMWLEGVYRSLARFQPGVSSPLLVEELRERMQEQFGISSPVAVPEKRGEH
ncbi:MAG: DUF4912 domain-containing protein [Thermoanaerobacterales bacterium]|nr:DUF4912 domain-containing protein [Thermoanaerobacterales bacterium]